MPTSVRLIPGRAYRTSELSKWDKNPSRLAKSLEAEGRLREIRKGLYYAPRMSKFGPVPPTDDELVRGFLQTSTYLFSGPDVWNTLRLGTTTVLPGRLVYNAKRSGRFELDNRTFLLRRTSVPRHPSPEWFVVDLLENHELAGSSIEDVAERLRRALGEKRFDVTRLLSAAHSSGTRPTQKLIESVVADAA